MRRYYKIICLFSLLEFGLTYQFEAFAKNDGNEVENPGKKNKGSKKKKTPRNAIVIAFDETGQMIKFPKPVIRRNQSVIFKVRMNRSTFAAQINKFFLSLDSTYDFFITHPENQFVLYSLFKDDTTMVLAWLDELKSYNAIRQELTNGKEYDLSQYTPTDASTFYTFANSMHYIPLPQYFKNLLFEQFKIRVYNRSNDISNIIPLNPDFKNKSSEKGDCYWWYSEPVSLDTLLGTHCASCENNLRFSLVNHDAWQETVLDWYNLKFDSLNKKLTNPLIKSAKPVLKEKLEYLIKANGELVKLAEVDEKEVDSVIQLIKNFSAKFNADGLPKPGELNPQFKIDSVRFINLVQGSDKTKPPFDIKPYLETLRSVQPWLFYWLWLNKGYLVVNPLPAYRVPSSDQTNESLDLAKKSLQRYQQQKNFLDSVRVHVADRLSNFQLFKNVQDSTDTVIHKLDSVNTWIKSLNKQIKEDSVAKVKSENASKQVGISGAQVYVGQLPIYGKTRWYQRRSLFPDKITIQKQFSYSASQQTISAIYHNQWQKTIGTEIPENERVLLVVHNIPKNSKISLTQTLSGFNDLEEFTVLFQKLLKGLDSTGLFQLALPAGFAGFSNFLQNTINRTSMSSAVATAAKHAGITASKTDAADALTFSYLQTSAKQSLVAFDTNLVVATSISKKIDTSGGYLTKTYPTVDSTAPYQVSIALTIDSVKAKSTIKVGALRWYQVAAGFAAVNSPVDQVSIDTSGSSFRTSSASNNSSVIVGFKIYPFRTYLRDGGFIPRYPLRRISAVIAFSIPKPLNNFYIGGGYDLVPGLAFTMGANIYKQNYYEVQNGRIAKSATRYAKGGTYYGVTVNPVILVQFVKLFFN